MHDEDSLPAPPLPHVPLPAPAKLLLLLLLQTAPKYDVQFMDFGNREHVTAPQVCASQGPLLLA